MLAKKYRLPIQLVLNKSGQTFRSRSFLIKTFTSNLEFNRFGVVISKKVDKRASKRNQIKRMLLDETKDFILQNNTPKLEVLIIVSPNMIKTGKTDIIEELKDLLQKIIK